MDKSRGPKRRRQADLSSNLTKIKKWMERDKLTYEQIARRLGTTRESITSMNTSRWQFRYHHGHGVALQPHLKEIKHWIEKEGLTYQQVAKRLGSPVTSIQNANSSDWHFKYKHARIPLQPHVAQIKRWMEVDRLTYEKIARRLRTTARSLAAMNYAYWHFDYKWRRAGKREKTPPIKLTKEERSVVLGCVLGDGFLANRELAHLQYVHGITQKGMTYWVANKLHRLGRRIRRNSNKNGFGGLTLTLYTLDHEELGKLRKLFYNRNGKKRVPLQLLHWFNRTVAKVWYFDDGSIQQRSSSRSSAITFSTHAFDRKSIRILIRCLGKVGVQGKIRHEKKWLVIKLGAEASRRFLRLIGSDFPACMRYKVPKCA